MAFQLPNRSILVAIVYKMQVTEASSLFLYKCVNYDHYIGTHEVKREKDQDVWTISEHDPARRRVLLWAGREWGHRTKRWSLPKTFLNKNRRQRYGWPPGQVGPCGRWFTGARGWRGGGMDGGVGWGERGQEYFNRSQTKSKKVKIRAVVVAQLVERSLLTPEMRSSNPVIGKFYLQSSYALRLFWKAHFLKKVEVLLKVFFCC